VRCDAGKGRPVLCGMRRFGDAVMAVWGTSVAADRDAEQAVRAGRVAEPRIRAPIMAAPVLGESAAVRDS
jgi:hypothetical protein